MNEENLKPVVIPDSPYVRNREDSEIQLLLLKALSEGVTDVNDLRKIIGAKNAADVFRTMDKLSIRQEYHKALSRCGITLESLVLGMKDLVDSPSEAIKLKALQTLMKSLGLEKYDKDETSTKTWEEAILNTPKKELEEGKEVEENGDYIVEQPEIPESVKIRQIEEKNLAKQLYEE